MSRSKPQSIEDLQRFVESHQNDGKINGSEVVQPSKLIGLDGWVPQDVYNQSLLLGASQGFTSKNEIAVTALHLFLNTPVISKDRETLDTPWNNRLFQGCIPESLHRMFLWKTERVRLSNSAAITLGLKAFAALPEVQGVYAEYIEKLMMQSGQPRNYIEMSILAWWRLKARQRRLEESLKLGYFVDDQKVAF